LRFNRPEFFNPEPLEGLTVIQQMTDARAIVAQAKERLRLVPYPGLKRLKLNFDSGVLTLGGKVRSFHLKQLAQEAVSDMGHVVNRIEVTGELVTAGGNSQNSSQGPTSN
jgi:hypothetical protein